ncbi:hypothetical protein D3C73_1437310 [compost metagenome]
MEGVLLAESKEIESERIDFGNLLTVSPFFSAGVSVISGEKDVAACTDDSEAVV